MRPDATTNQFITPPRHVVGDVTEIQVGDGLAVVVIVTPPSL